MTETYGYLCPKCLGWWTTFLNRNGPDKSELYCACHVRKDRAVFIYRKTLGNHYLAKDGVARLKVEITCMGEILEFWTEEWVEKSRLWQLVDEKLREKNDPVLDQHRSLIYIALQKATRSRSGASFKDRCPKCKRHSECKREHVFMSTSCESFDLKQSIQEFLDKGHKPLYLQPEVR